MNIKELKSLWLSDLYRYSGTTKLKDLLKYIVLVPGPYIFILHEIM